MKTSLLLATLFALTFNSSAQNLPLFQNFENGLPPGWQLKAADIGSYDRNMNGSCVTDNQGVVAGPSVGSNGGNKSGFLTDTLRSVEGNAFVIVNFEGFAYKGNRLRCQDQLFGSTPCTAIGELFIVSVATGDTIGSSAVTNLNLTSGQNTLIAQVNADVPLNTEFRVLLDVSQLSCEVNGSLRFVIDNVSISVTAGGPLAVQFQSFKATRTSAQNVMVNWVTASEQNNKGFYVQRNTKGTWENISFIASKASNGNSAGALSYSFSDLNSHRGISQYRIVQVDMNAVQKMSAVSIVRGEGGGNMIVFPNPSIDGNASILFEEQNSARDVALFDMTGKVVKQWTNVNSNSLKLDNLRQGVYSIRVVNRSTGERAVQKLIVN